MFGLMSPQGSCSNNCNSLQHIHRKHYCGTCKTIGQHYGHSARAMLNFDAVFLAEILSLLAEDDTNSWQSSLQKVNLCWSMPKQGSDDSMALKYAATINVLLGELKIKDHIHDNEKKRWKWANRYFSPSFHKAKKQLFDWGISIETIERLASEQQQIEQVRPINAPNLESFLDYYATATARITAICFEQGANLIQKQNSAALLYKLGYEFGQLAYLLDAFEDLERDIYNKEFNPIALFYNCNSCLEEEQLESIRKLLLKKQALVVDLIQGLEIDSNHQAFFVQRLKSAIALQIYRDRKIIIRPKKRIRNRWQAAKETANSVFCNQKKGWMQLRYYMVAFSVFISPQATEQIIPSDSKSMIFSWVAFITAIIGSLAAGIFFNSPIERNKRKKRRELRKKRRELRKKKKQFCCGNDPCGCKACNRTCKEWGKTCCCFLIISIDTLIALCLFVATLAFLLGVWDASFFLILGLVLAPLMIAWGLNLNSGRNNTQTLRMVSIALAILLLITCLIVIIVGIVFLLAVYSPLILTAVIIAGLALIALFIIFFSSNTYEDML